MSYKIGQTKNVSPRVNTIPIEKINSSVIIEDSTDRPFNEIGYSINRTLDSKENYYLSFSVERIEQGHYRQEGSAKDYSTITFGVYLMKDGSSTGKYELGQILGNFVVQACPVTTPIEDRIVNFELLFTPENPEYNYIGFVIARENYDYIVLDSRELPLVTTGNKKPTLNQLINFVPNNIKITKLGVQSRPGLLMCINGEPIRIGRSGVYEINNGYPIKFFNIPSSDRFILDYAYNDD